MEYGEAGGSVILTLGDSVTWGQGLLDEHKLDRICAEGKPLARLAHSGALLGSPRDSSNQREHPEIPVGYPSIWQQMASVNDWNDIEVVILNGGINDVSLARILNPWIAAEQIAQLANQFCATEMERFLCKLVSLVKTEARVLVVGYYPILSGQSKPLDEKQPRMLMEMHGVATSSVAMNTTIEIGSLMPRIVENCITFWQASAKSLKSTVEAVNTAAARPICFFVDPGFTEENALWAGDPLLWQLTIELDAEDEVKALRDQECGSCYGDLVHIPEWGEWYTCCRASVGHPNVAGAAKISSQFMGLVT
ncbi:MAG: hypothetical protein ABSB50_08695 [Terracidiphilus sp.]